MARAAAALRWTGEYPHLTPVGEVENTPPPTSAAKKRRRWARGIVFFEFVYGRGIARDEPSQDRRGEQCGGSIIERAEAATSTKAQRIKITSVLVMNFKGGARRYKVLLVAVKTASESDLDVIFGALEVSNFTAPSARNEFRDILTGVVTNCPYI